MQVKLSLDGGLVIRSVETALRTYSDGQIANNLNTPLLFAYAMEAEERPTKIRRISSPDASIDKTPMATKIVAGDQNEDRHLNPDTDGGVLPQSTIGANGSDMTINGQVFYKAPVRGTVTFTNRNKSRLLLQQ